MSAESTPDAEDVEELVARVADAARAAFTEAREKHPDDSFYCFALFTDAFAAYVLPTCMSEGGLAQVARHYAEESGRPLDEEAASLRWAPVDSPHHMLGEEHFDGVLELLQSRGDPWQLVDKDERDDEEFDDEVNLRFEACFRALALLDDEGLFGSGTVREQVVVNVLQGDQSDRSILGNARRLNPPAAAERLARDLDIPVPVGDFATLGSTGAYQVSGLAYAAEAGRLVACGSGGELYAWDLDGDHELLATRHDSSYWEVVISSDGRTVLLNDHKRVRRIGLPEGTGHDTAVENAWTIALSPSGATVAAGIDGSVRAFDLAAGGELWRLEGAASCLRFSGDGALLAVAADRALGGVVLVDAADGTPRQELIATESGTEHRLAWSADSQILATGECRSRRIRLWRRAPDGFTAGPVLGPPPHHGPADGYDDELRDLAFSPDGGLLACAHSNGDVHLWNAGTGRHVRHLRGLQESMAVVAFLDDHRLAAAGRDVESGPPVYVWPLNR
ncbi:MULTISPECIES: DUF4303 domain-containing protein [unclassified Spirillospora]|uniref:DUF4303 domain-containing protein n=1 Tax=unclassified Spirillospora TaxID=2642701 RepID=UPI0037241B7D